MYRFGCFKEGRVGWLEADFEGFSVLFCIVLGFGFLFFRGGD